MRWTKLCDLARELPEVTVEHWWGTPGLKVAGKGFARRPITTRATRPASRAWRP